MTRDFTYIDDIVEGVIRVSDKTATPNKSFLSEAPDPATSNAPYRVFNIGNSQPTPLMDYISAIENALNIQAKKNFLPMQPGDVQSTSADTAELNEWINFKPNTPVTDGVAKFVNWYQNFYQSL
jgi:UDP-glucuronate 4-epimerase